MKIDGDFDVVVVGSGPAGATTARSCAEGGLRTLVVDKKQELGSPIQCSGAVSANALRSAGIALDDEFLSASVHGFSVFDGEGEESLLDLRRASPEPAGYVVDRRRFDRHLMRTAQQAGAEAWLKAEALGHEPQDGGTTLLRIRQFGAVRTVRTRVIVGADGLQSQVGRWAGLTTRIRLPELASCLQYVVDGVETRGLLEIVTGSQWAPGGYAWLFPKANGQAEVGLGVSRTMTDRDARWHLERFLRESFLRARFAGMRILEVQGGGVPLTAPLRRQYDDHIILVGDAARHVNPITGGGIHTALRGGILAGAFLREVLPTGEPPTADLLRGYQERWEGDFGKALRQLYTVRSALNRVPDVDRQDRELHQVFANYFRPGSPYRYI